VKSRVACLTLLCFGLPKAEKQQKAAAPPTTITTESNTMKRLINGLPETYVEINTMLSDLMDTLTLKGYYLVPWKPCIIPPCSINRTMRQCAKDMGRPFVKISNNRNFALMTIPKRKYLAPIANLLLLAASDTTGRAVVDRSEETNWRFLFNDMELFKSFLEQLHTRPELRKALKLPEEVTP